MTKVYLFLLFYVIAQAPLQSQNFPDDWEGLWEGNLEIWVQGSLKNTVPMSLEIKPKNDQSWDFIITYNAGSDQEDERAYLLKTVDEEKNHYLIDELNGIKLDAYLYDQCLVEDFEVMGSAIFSQICRIDEQSLSYDIYAHSSSRYQLSGDTIINTDTIPAVKSFPIGNLTKAILKKHE